MAKNNLDKIAFWEDFRSLVLPTLIAISVIICFLIFGLNVVVSQEDATGRIIRNSVARHTKSQNTLITYIELKSERTIYAALPAEAALLRVGSDVIVTRYIKRFFGDSFGLK
jgi:hypothetical protein